MAKVNEVPLCPNCENTLETTTRGNCKACGFAVIPKDNPIFGGPEYFSIQRDYAAEVASQEKSKAKQDERSREITEAAIDWLKNCSDIDRNAALEDAFSLLQYATQSNASIETIKRMTRLGKIIGELAKSIEGYVSAGGALNNEKSESPKPGDRTKSPDEA